VAVARAAAREAAAMVEATVAVGRVAVRAGEARAAVRAGEARVAARAGAVTAAARADRCLCRAPSLEVASRPDVSELVRVTLRVSARRGLAELSFTIKQVCLS
jgi:hypothetical protein